LDAARKAADAQATSTEGIKASMEVADGFFATFMGGLNRLVNLAGLAFLAVLGKIADLIGPTVQKYAGELFSTSGVTTDALQAALGTAVSEAFKDASSNVVGGKLGASEAVVAGLRTRYRGVQMRAGAACVDFVLDKIKAWPDLDEEQTKTAIRWYWEDVDAASFTGEASEEWQDFAANMADWLEFLVVWAVRIVNIVLGIVGLVAAIPTAGASAAAAVAAQQALSQAVDRFDDLWDAIKAVATGGKVWGVWSQASAYCGVHTVFTAKAFADGAVVDRAAAAMRAP
jgi:hypothetical protein